MTKWFTGSIMVMSGVALTCSSAWLGIHGLLIFFPEPVLRHGILFLGVALEPAKVFTAVFLFHHGRDASLPRFIRGYMATGVAALVLISGAATYIHLTYYVADYVRQEDATVAATQRASRELEVVRAERAMIDRQVASLPSGSVRGRVQLLSKFDRRKRQIDSREEAILGRLDVADRAKAEPEGKKRE